MRRLLRISLDTLLTSTLPIVMWVLLGIIVNKNISNSVYYNFVNINFWLWS